MYTLLQSLQSQRQLANPTQDIRLSNFVANTLSVTEKALLRFREKDLFV